MADEKKGVKEIEELLLGLKEVALLAKKALKDGKINLADLPLLTELLTKQKVLVDALSGLGELGEEVKDLDLNEGLQLVMKLVQIAKEVKDA